MEDHAAFLVLPVVSFFSPFRIRLYDTAIRLGELQAQFKVPVDPEEYARDNLKFGLVEVVYEWAKVSHSSTINIVNTFF